MQAKTLYTSCMDVHAMNELGLSSLYDLLGLLNIPVIPASLTNVTSNYIEQIARVKKILGQDIFFGFGIMPDLKNNSRNIIAFYPPELDSPFPRDKELEKRLRTIRSRLRKLEDLDDEATLSEDEDAELTYITDVVNQVINNGTINVCNSDYSIVPKEELDELVETLYTMSNYINYVIILDGNLTIYEEILNDDDYMLVDDLQKLTDEYVISRNSTYMPKPIWRPFIESIFDSIATLDLDKNKILIGNLKYLKDMALIFANIEEQDLESYIWWAVVNVVAPHSSEKLRDSWTTYLNNLRNILDIEMGESKSLQCASAVNELMGMAVSWLFVDPTFHDNEALKVREMLENIKEAFASLVVKTDWMDQSTKTVTLEKNRKMSSKIGFPKWLFNKEELNQYYEGVRFKLRMYIKTFCDRCTRIILTYPFFSLFATYAAIPAGILQFPFYELGLEALNYGAIGSILGHELSHGFDNSGRLYDSDGNLRQWWTNETSTEYTKRTQCFIEHYNTYYEPVIDQYIDGEETLDENIADNVGLREAVIAYERWKTRHGQEPLLPGFTQFTHEQLLYLAFAHVWCESYTTASLKWLLDDTHSPPHVRLRAVLKNSKEFSATWNCPAESNMNPSKKCHLW
ncbi:Neprilysin-1 [Ooceraea biroi]|uniref:Neprilysin-1 n=1 Tax=Ooceraea biroi TaxID=2015173 RepID=A0A026WY18_OOCBI|nr:Neprilysin-1 [Ooceraea biroi]